MNTLLATVFMDGPVKPDHDGWGTSPNPA